MESSKGITLVGLVVTIIVIIIIASITIPLLTEDDGIIKSSKSTKEQSEIKSERTVVEKSATFAMTNDRYGKVSEEQLGYEIDKYTGRGKTSLTEDIFSIIVEFVETNRCYDVDVESGNVKLIPFPLSAAGIEFEYDPVQDSDHWTNGDVKVTVNITNTGMYEDLKNYKILYRLEQDTEWKDYDKNNKIDVTKNQYVYAKLESDGGRTLVATGEVKYIDKIAPVVVAEKEGDTITVKLTDEQSGVCGYAITTTNAKPSLSEFTRFAATSKWSKTLTGYYGTKYYVWAIDKAGNIGSNQQITTQEVLTAKGNIKLAQNPTVWTNGDVTVTATTTVQGLQIQMSQDGVKWDVRSDNQEIRTENGEVYARFWDGTSGGEYTSIIVTNIDKVKPTITYDYTYDKTWKKTSSVIVTLEDNASGLATGGSVKYGWSKSATEEPSSYTTVNLSYSKGDKSTAFTAESNGLTGMYYLWVVPENFKDVAGNSAVTEIHGAYYLDNTGPNVTFGTNGTGGVWKTSISTTVNATDSGSGIAEIRGRWMEGTAQLSQKSDFTGDGGWEISNGETSLSNPSKNGQWYLWIYAEDNLGNWTVTHSNEFLLDTISPTITYDPTFSKDWSKTHSVTITIEDNVSGIAAGASVKYGWTEVRETEPTSYTTVPLSYTEGDKSITFTATGSGLTGKYYYLWVVPTNLKDLAGNATGKVDHGAYYFDNVGPVVTFGTDGTGGVWKTSISTTVNATDSGSGVAEIRGRWMQGTAQLSQKSDFTGAGGWEISNGETSLSNPGNGHWYLWIYAEDNLGNWTVTHSKEFLVDSTAPTIISITGEFISTTQFNLTITAKDEHSGISKRCIKTTTPTPTDTDTNWNTFTVAGGSEGSFTVTRNLGTYYVWVKDNAGNLSDVKSVRATDIDNSPPTITLGSNSNTTWSKTSSVTVTVADSGSGLAAGASIKYGWSTSATTAPSSYTTATLSYAAGDKSTTFKATSSGLTGKYYLWVVPETLKDVAGNSNTTTVKSTGTFYLDNTKPTVGSGTVTATSATTFKLSLTGFADAHSGLSKQIISTSSTVPTASSSNWVDETDGSFSLTNAAPNTTYYVWVMDKAGNISATFTYKTTSVNYSVDNTSWQETLAQAVSASSTNSTIKLLTNNYTDVSVVTINKTLTYDSNGKTLNRTKKISISSGFTVTITGTGTIKNTGTTEDTIESSGTLKVSGGTITGASGHAAIWQKANTLTISGGTISTSGSGSRAVSITDTGALTMTAGTVQSTGASDGIYIGSGRTANISGGTVKNTSNGYAINTAGTTKISSGTITATKNDAIYNKGVLTVSNGTISTTQELHAAIGNYEGSATVRGGTITGTGFGIYSRGATNLTITGGTIKANATTGSEYSDGIYIEQDSGYTANILSSTITGNNYGITVGGSNQASVRLGLRDTENYGGLYIEGTGKTGVSYSGSGSLEIDGKDVEENSGTRIYRRSIWNCL